MRQPLPPLDSEQELYYRAYRPRDAITDARAWLRDYLADDERVICGAEWRLVIITTDRVYPGGWVQFLSDSGNLNEASANSCFSRV